MARRPAVAGMFYEADVRELVARIEDCFLGRFGPGKLPAVRHDRLGKVLGLVSPHAGYVYSGGAAAHAFAALASDGLPRTAVILGPNHHGLGAAAAVSAGGEWMTPLGTVQVDADMADAIIRYSEYAQPDDTAHLREHSIEVQIPFLQYLSSMTPSPRPSPAGGEGDRGWSHPAGGEGVAIVPIAIAHLSQGDALLLARDLGSAVAKALDGKNAVVIASTDFTHYESQTSAHEKDSAAIERIRELDAVGLIRVTHERAITMCGVIGTAVMIEACKALGATSARKLAYYTSGDVTGDTSQVVGYAALSIES